MLTLLPGCHVIFDYSRDDRWGFACTPRDDSERAKQLESHVRWLAERIGARSYRNPTQLEEAATYIEEQFKAVGGPSVIPTPCSSEGRPVPTPCSYRPDAWLAQISREAKCRHCDEDWSRADTDSGTCDPKANPTMCSQSELIRRLSEAGTFRNIELRLPGRIPGSGVVVVGAHYDSDTCESHGRNPGADDNASGVAAVIELAKALSRTTLDRDVRFVAFTNEEEPFFWTEAMGSREYARQARAEKVNITAMLSIETIGYYSDVQQSQDPVPVFNWFSDLPNTGDFIAFVGDRCSSGLVNQAVAQFRRAECFPANGISALRKLPGIGWSDHWSFWQEGYPAIMVTDTAPNRNHCYHRTCDVPDRLDYPKMARVVDGLEAVITALAMVTPPPTPPSSTPGPCGCLQAMPPDILPATPTSQP